MSSSSDQSPPSDSPPNSNSPPSSTPPSSSSSSSPPPPQDSSPPPPNDSSPPPPPDDSSPPPPKDSDSPPPPSDKNSPPPDNNNNNSSPPSDNNNNNNNSNNNSTPPSGNNNNNNNGSPPSDNNNNNDNKKKSPPPPSPSGSSNGHSHPPPPPPPPPPSRSLSPGHRSPSHSSSTSSGHIDVSDNAKAIIAGVAAGVGLLLILMIVCLICCCRRKKRKPRDQMSYYRDNSRGNYYTSAQHAQWNRPQSNDPSVKPPPPPGSTGVSSEYGGWAAAPPPPPPPMSSSDMSSSAFSGPYGPAMPPPHPALALGFNKSSFTYDELAAATGGFAKSNLLGQGGFGYVHKGTLPNGKEVAVKSLKSGSGQGEREFQAEVDIISRVHHRHLVSLVGYCIAGSQRMLVYEFVSNNTLEFHLHGKGNPVMDWPSRLRIAMGSAKGFAYLHEDCHPKIIHRDIKAANILLDEHYEAKVADFGLAKLSTDNHTHVSTRIMGTFGYLAPEYASSGKLTEKSDVYSYGVMLLELITGKRPVDASGDYDTLIDWARPMLMHASDGGGYEELVDPRLEDNYDPQEMLRMVACAAACIRHSARRRPKMSQIVRALEGDALLEDLHEGVKPGHSTVFGSGDSSSEYDSHSYNSELRKFRKPGLMSQEFTSSEHGLTGEFVQSSGESQELRSTRSRMRTP